MPRIKLDVIVLVVLVAVLFYGNRLGALWNMLSNTLPGG